MPAKGPEFEKQVLERLDAIEEALQNLEASIALIQASIESPVEE
jgi:hypothetical protein